MHSQADKEVSIHKHFKANGLSPAYIVHNFASWSQTN